jgi:hypothetical protein
MLPPTAFRCALCLLCCCALLPRAVAQVADEDPGTSWALGLAGQIDEESSDSLLGTFNLGIGDQTWLMFAAGRSRSPSGLADASAETLGAGVDHRFGVVGVAFELERWGDPDALESADMRFSFYIQKPRFRIALAHERRDIDIPFTVTGPLGGTQSRTASLSADSVALNLRAQPAERWQLYFGMSEHDYERNLALLPRISQLNLLSASTLTLANSFIDHERMVGFETDVGRSLVHVGFTRDESAVDGSILETVNAGVMFPIARRIDLEFNLGSGRSDLLESGLYGGLLLLIYGR